VNVTDTVHDAPAARELPQVVVSANGDPVVIEEIAAAAVPVLAIVTDCAALLDPTVSLPNDKEVGDAVSVALPLLPPPEPGKISNSDSCAAVHPLFAVKDNSRYWSFVPDGRLTLTVLPVAGLKVYVADGTNVVNVVPLVEPRIERVCVRVDHAVAGGRSSVTEPSEKL
jgi:hypothetical protein